MQNNKQDTYKKIFFPHLQYILHVLHTANFVSHKNDVLRYQMQHTIDEMLTDNAATLVLGKANCIKMGISQGAITY